MDLLNFLGMCKMEETQLTKEEAEAKASEIMAQILDDM